MLLQVAVGTVPIRHRYDDRHPPESTSRRKNMDEISRVAFMQVPATFSGVVRIDRAGEVLHESAHGMADRAHSIPNTPSTRIGVASGAKGLTALAVRALVDRGTLTLDTTARSPAG